MKLFEDMKIGSMTVKNRIVMAPMGMSAEGDGGYSRRAIRFYEERAKGGVGMVITGRNAVTTKYEQYSHHLLDSYHHIARLGELAETVHQYGTKLCVQLGPGLGRMVHTDPFNPPYSASAIPAMWNPHLTCRPLSVEDIQYIVEKVGFAASLAKRAEADAVELHAYGGYLADQFMSSQWNKRTDQYGGSLENRMRFVLEMVESIRKFCGPDFPVIMKYTAFHDIPEGRSLEEGVEMAKIFETAGVDALHIDMGCYEKWYRAIPTVYDEEGCQLAVTEVTRHVKIPVLVQGKLADPALAEQVLQENKADFICLGHQMLTDPAWVKKVKEGRTYDIVPCIGCNECLLTGKQGIHLRCAVNPECLHEDDYPLHPLPQTRRVLVIGGGPAGMQAALTAVRRGFEVELWEKSAVLGGNMLTAGAPDSKKDIMNFRNYLVRNLHSSPVRVRMNMEATEEAALAGNFDHVIVACGAAPVIPPIPGIQGEHVTTAEEVLLGKVKLEGDIVIIGGGLVGCETALYCKERTNSGVTVIEFMHDILAAAKESANNEKKIRALLKENNTQILAKAKVTQITGEGVAYVREGEEGFVPCTTVIVAAGYRPNHAVYEALKGKVKNISVAGDAVRARNIMWAVHEGFHAARLVGLEVV